MKDLYWYRNFAKAWGFLYFTYSGSGNSPGITNTYANNRVVFPLNPGQKIDLSFMRCLLREPISTCSADLLSLKIHFGEEKKKGDFFFNLFEETF